MTKNKRFLIGLLLVFAACGVLLVAAGAAVFVFHQAGTETGVSDKTKTVSFETFSKLEQGMLFTDARKTIGWQGELLSDSQIGETRLQLMRWKNPDGSYLECTFKDGDLMSKRQHGLK